MRERSRSDRLDRRLQSDRPQPRDEFVASLAVRLVAEPIRRSAGLRVALAAGFTAVLVVAFALTGGIVYAANAVQGGTTAVTSLVTGPSKVHKVKKTDATGQTSSATQESSSSSTTPASSSTSATAELSSSSEEESGSGDDEEEPNGDDEEDDDGPADDQYEDDVLICHHRPNGETRTIEIDADELTRHLAHGDTEGPCPDDDDDEEDDD